MISAVLFVTVLIDVRYHRIPNMILVILLLIRLLSALLQTIADGSFTDPEILLPRYLTVLFIFIILYFFFSTGTLGAGDLKLIVVTALSVCDPLKYTLLIFVTGSVMSVFLMLRNGILRKRFKTFASYIGRCIGKGRALPYHDATVGPEEKIGYSLHLSIPVFVSFVIISIIGAQ